MDASNWSVSRLPPVVVLGAARSGTKLLRSIVAASDEYAAVPHDVNYVWRHSASRHADDELLADTVSTETQRYVRRQLERMAGVRHDRTTTFVEKTVSNTLRVPFVDRVLPSAKYIHLLRDGRDVTASAMRCWTAPPEYGRLFKKMATFPWSTCAGYALGCARDWAVRFASNERQLRSWGPRYRGIDDDVRNRSLAEVCALQWAASVRHTRPMLAQLPRERWIEVRYEELTAQPAATAARIAQFLDVRRPRQVIEMAVESVRPQRPKAEQGEAPTDAPEVVRILAPLLEETGYAAAQAA